MQYLSFCDWFISLSKMSSRFIHVIADDTAGFLSFSFKAEFIFAFGVVHKEDKIP